MPALPNYIPSRDTDFNSWADNFSSLLTANPPLYGLTPADAVVVAAAVASWDAAYAAAIDGITRGPFTIAAKDTQRTDTTAVLRPYAQAIANNAGVSSADKIAIGVNPRNTPPSPVTIPTTSPFLTVVSAIQLLHTLRYRDELASPTVKAKPYGVLQIQLFATASATPIVDPAALDFIGGFTKSPLQVEWQAGDANKVAYYAARWVTRTGLVGPWSPIVSFSVASGSM